MTDDIMDGKDMINLNMKGGEFGDDTIMQKIIRNFLNRIYLIH